MQKKSNKIISFVLGLMLLFSPLAQAQEEVTEVVQQSSLLLQLKQKLAQIQYRYTLLEGNVERAEDNLLEIEEASLLLEEVIANLDQQLKEKNRTILNVKSQKEERKMDLAGLEEEVEILDLQLEDQKTIVAEFMTLIYVKRGVYYDEDGVNAVKVLASPDSVSETLQDLTYLNLMEAEHQEQVEKMMELSEELTEKWSTLRNKRQELNDLDSILAEEQHRLQEERDAQQAMLDEMLGEKAILEAMLESADQRDDELLQEIRIYENNVRSMEEKLAGAEGLLSEDQQALIAQIEAEMLESIRGDLAAELLELKWPVSPSGGLTALFHDEGYKGLFGVDHYAVDIRSKQGSPIFAPADGVVTEVVYEENSTRYAYIMIAHRMGVMTLVGHISKPAVAAGDFVTQGMLIAASGGDPHSIGAGVRTTGPHVHFEVWQDGARVDPLNYLPLEEVPGDSLPEEYQEELQAQLEAEIKEMEDLINH